MRSIRFKRNLLSTIVVFYWFAQYVYIPFLTPHLLSLSITATMTGIIVGAYGFTQLVLRIPIGISADIVKNHKLFITIGMILAGTSSLIMMLFPTPGILLIANGISGMASAMWISFTILYAAYYDDSEGVKAIGKITVFCNIGLLIAYATGGLLYERFGMNTLFIASFISGMIGLALSSLIEKEPAAGGTNVSIKSLISVMKDKKLILLTSLCTLLMFVIFATVFSFTTSTAEEMGATGLKLGMLSITYSVASIIGAYFIGTGPAGRLGTKRIIVISFLMIAAYCVGISVAPGLGYFYPLQFVCGLGYGMVYSTLMAGSIRDIAIEKRSTAMGFFQSVYSVGITVGPIAMGVFVDNTTSIGMFKTPFLLMAVITVACVLLVLTISRNGILFTRPQK